MVVERNSITAMRSKNCRPKADTGQCQLCILWLLSKDKKDREQVISRQVPNSGREVSSSYLNHHSTKAFLINFIHCLQTATQMRHSMERLQLKLS